MIKINLSDEYIHDSEVAKVFEKIAEKVYNTGKSANYSFLYKAHSIPFEKVNILKFLLSKDFYDYQLLIPGKNGDEVSSLAINDWLALPKCSPSTILNDRSNANILVRKFHSKYMSKGNFSNNIEEFIKANHTNKITNKWLGNFVFEYYNSYLSLQNIFSYEFLDDEDRHSIVSKMNVSVCPYCNMNYTIKYYNTHGNIKATADIDHFYPKSIYPIYSLCLFNFVPSCQVCNSRLKASRNTTVQTHVLPHKDSFDGKAHFAISNFWEVYMQTRKENTPNVTLYQHAEDVKCINSGELFQIENRYKELAHIAEEWLEKTKVYNESFRGELSSLLGDEWSETALKSFVFGNKLTEAEMLNTSLGKFKNDLLKQFGIF